MSDRLDAAVREFVDALRAELQVETTTPAPDRLLSIDEAAEVVGVGRTRLYADIGAGRLRSVTVGRRRLVPVKAIADYIASQAA